MTKKLTSFCLAFVLSLCYLSAANAEEVARPKANDECESYTMILNRKIKRAWNPPKGSVPHKVVTQFRIHSDGSISCLKIYRSSKNKAADQAALAAVRAAAPFPQLPEGTPPKVDLRFTFESKALAEKKNENE